MKHPSSIKGFDSAKQAAQTFANLRYDMLALFLEELASAVGRDARKDLSNKRSKLATNLLMVAHDIKSASENTKLAWDVCQSACNHDWNNNYCALCGVTKQPERDRP